MSPLVSIIIPCYNVECFIHNLLHSLLMQDYDKMQFIFVNDGSVDHSKDVIFSFKHEIENKGFLFDYLEKENGGLSSAINAGLQLVKGTYLIWPDPDDFFISSVGISKMVNALEYSSDEYSCVRVLTYNLPLKNKLSLVNLYEDVISQGIQNLGQKIVPQDILKEDLFEDFFNWNSNVWPPAGSIMVKVPFLFSVLKSRKIYSTRNVGQNFQLLLPILYNKKCITLPEYMYCLLIRKESHSRGLYGNYDKKKTRWEESKRMVCATINTLPMETSLKERYNKITKKRYNKIIRNTAREHFQLLDYIKYGFKSLF